MVSLWMAEPAAPAPHEPEPEPTPLHFRGWALKLGTINITGGEPNESQSSDYNDLF
jgi:hypothetical protein